MTASMRTAKRQDVWDMTDGRCSYCRCELRPDGIEGRSGDPRHQMHVDHKVPTKRGGSEALDNLAPACGFCNMQKSCRTPEEYKIYLFDLGIVPKFLDDPGAKRDWIAVPKSSDERKGNPLSNFVGHPHKPKFLPISWPPHAVVVA